MAPRRRSLGTRLASLLQYAVLRAGVRRLPVTVEYLLIVAATSAILVSVIYLMFDMAKTVAA